MGGNGIVVSMTELSKHTSPQDCWLLIHGKVYDVTKFLYNHPGGYDLLLENSGHDATEGFEGAGHDDNARAMMNDFYVGDIDLTTTVNDIIGTITLNQDKNNSELLSVTMFQFLVLLLILGLALGVRFYGKTPSPP